MNKHYLVLEHVDSFILTNYGEAFRIVFWNTWELVPDKNVDYVDFSAKKRQIYYNPAILEETYKPKTQSEPEWQEIFDLFLEHSFVCVLITYLLYGDLFYSYSNVSKEASSSPVMEIN